MSRPTHGQEDAPGSRPIVAQRVREIPPPAPRPGSEPLMPTLTRAELDEVRRRERTSSRRVNVALAVTALLVVITAVALIVGV